LAGITACAGPVAVFLRATCDVCTPHTGDGIHAVNSSNLQVGTGPDCPANGPCNDVTYDDGIGIWLQDTHDVVIDHAMADADDTGGYVLDGSTAVLPPSTCKS